MTSNQRKIRVLFAALVCVLVNVASTGTTVNAETQEDLQRIIDSKTQEMKILEAERKALESNLSHVSKTTRSLTSEISTIEGTVKQLEVGIATNKIAAEKLKYELEAISLEMQDLGQNLSGQKSSLSKLILELQARENEGFFMTFMKKKTLSENMLEYESIKALNSALIDNLNSLREEQVKLKEKRTESEKKKRERENEQLTLASRQSIIQDQKEEKKRLLEQTRNQEKVFETKIEELEKKQAEISKTIEQFEEKIRLSFNPSLLPVKRVGVFSSPVLGGVVTQTYGATKFAERAYKTKSHNGLDFGVPVGTPVYAAEDGVVKAAQNNDRGSARWQKYQYGKYIVITHSNNLATLYSHLSGHVVREGQTLKRGDLIGYSGNTGYATGPHLHFGVYWAPSLEFKNVPPANDTVPVGVTIDPSDYL